MTATELAWLAGVFEGEGSVRIGGFSVRNLGSLCVDMVNTDDALVLPFHDQWGGYLRRVEPPPPRSSYLRWRIAASRAVEFLLAIRPYVRSPRMHDRIALALAYQSQKTGDQRINRTLAYKAEQEDFYRQMAVLNLRGQRTQEREEQ